jgi:hypothetical protein
MPTAVRRVTVTPARAALPVLLAVLLLRAPPVQAGAVPGYLDGVGGDTLLTLSARRTLVADADLAPLNIGVSVHWGVATLWGAVPSPALAGRAADLLRRQPQFREVRNTLLIVPRTPPPGDDIAPDTPAAVTGGSAPGGELAAMPGTRGPTAAQPLSTASPPGDDAPRITLGQPTAGEAAGPHPLSDAAATLGKPAAIPHPAQGADLADAVERLRRGDDRFGQVRPEVRGRVILLRGGRPDRLDVMAFAQAVARLPGVERVVVEPDPAGR